ncbi:acyltransferase [Spirosoma validum]|uniref:Acyltransferase n=1 Tax=Spirosoma validum TaxID=2771355 RepID=A0A927B0I0_9BACT|nr:acyltransferase [Spirosoma validum]MBD2753306.1 acyltransferase [Spirosoma validum]
MLVKIIVTLLPWPLKRWCLQRWFKYDIHPTARIGYSWIFPKKLTMHEGAKIGHFNAAIHLDYLSLSAYASISRGNWITGFPKNTNSYHFAHQTDRLPELYLGEHASITKNHHLDCTNKISIGRFTTVAGYQSQFLTHSVDVNENRQDSNPITIGEYTFIGTNAVILGGAVLPDFSVLGAKSLLNKAYTDEWMIYGGVPAKALQNIPKTAKYFTRSKGFVI